MLSYISSQFQTVLYTHSTNVISFRVYSKSKARHFCKFTIARLFFSFQCYVIVTKCDNCHFHNTTRNQTNNTSLSLNLSCGNTYTFTVRAITRYCSSPGSETSVSTKSQADAVTNLVVRLHHYTKGNNWFLLTWSPPKNIQAATIKVGNKLLL